VEDEKYLSKTSEHCLDHIFSHVNWFFDVLMLMVPPEKNTDANEILMFGDYYLTGYAVFLDVLDEADGITVEGYWYQ